MSEVYWVAGGTVELPAGREYPAAALDWLRRSGIQPGWISEIEWLSAPEAWSPAPRWPPGLAAFTWAAQPLLDHALLHAACQAILSGEQDMLLLGAAGEGQAHLAVLASPKAVGRYNLLPRARLPGRFALPLQDGILPDLPAVLAPQIKKLELAVEDIHLIAACGGSETLPEAWNRVPAAPGCALAQCGALVTGLESIGGKLGLLAGLPAEGTALLALVERI